MKEEMSVIRITTRTKKKIRVLAEEHGLKEITILEYLLSGKISINKLK